MVATHKLTRAPGPGDVCMRRSVILLPCLLVAACGERGSTLSTTLPHQDAVFQEELQRKFLDAKPGTVIEIPPGTHQLDRTLVLRTNGVTVRGAGTARAILSFKSETTGPGMLVAANDFTVENLSIEDAKTDGLQLSDGDHIAIRALRVSWTGGPKVTNGSYGISAIRAKNVLIEDCEAFSASAAGIRVAASNTVIVRRCHAEQNVAGIAVENTIGTQMDDNILTGNTGGIVLANLPEFTPSGHTASVFKNRIYKNNLANFAAQGTALATIPAGVGIMVLAAKGVEIFDNDIAGNQTANILIRANLPAVSGNPPGGDPRFDPYPRAIYLYGNRFAPGGYAPDGTDLKSLKNTLFGADGHFPDIVWDGYRDASNLVGGQPPAAERICVDTGTVTVLNLDAPHQEQKPSTEVEPWRCQLAKLPPLEFPSKS